jgi:acyl-CoA dehydrogenase
MIYGVSRVGSAVVFALCIVVMLLLAYRRTPLAGWLVSLPLFAAATLMFARPAWWAFLPLVVCELALVGVAIRPLRRKLVTAPLFRWFKRALPALSETEQQALDAGTVWWDAELFTGKPNWSRLLDAPKPYLTKDEYAFLEGPTETLAAMVDPWSVHQNQDLPPEVWSFIKSNGFFGLMIDKAYGGLGFSAMANSAIVMKLASRDLTTAVTVMVPNSLGPGELLQHYGTEEQKRYYLPRLARGEEIPCFALTSAAAGSDAGAMPDTGVVCHGEWQGETVLGLRLNWSKRYITLAPVATLLGLAFRTLDPDRLLGRDSEDLGITCALIPTDIAGVHIGRRHLPSGAAFMNGPTQGVDVFVPLDAVIGGREMIGHGWRMLVQSLAAGRAISLPALGTAGSKLAAHTTGAYTRIRKQFKMPIGYFEGVEEVLARLAGNVYRTDATRLLTLVALGMGEKPSVLTAIAKSYLTEANRLAINDAMDVHAGKGIIQGPRNYLNLLYQAIPIGITVEGANILTRTMIVFGQGAIRAHPYILKEMQTSRNPDEQAALVDFDDTFFRHAGFTISNLVRTCWMGLTGARLVFAPVNGPTAHYFRQLTRMSAAFAMISDLVLMVLGGSFKFREKLSGRLADVLAHLYMCSAVLKRFEDTRRQKEDLALVNWAMRDSLYVIQNRLINVIRNFPIWWLRRPLRALVFPLGLSYREPSDTLGKRAARVLLNESMTRDRLIAGIYQSKGDDALGDLNRAFAATHRAAAAERRLRALTHEVVTIANFEALIEQGRAKGLSEVEARLIRDAQLAARKVIEVDDFAREEVEPRRLQDRGPATSPTSSDRRL